MSTITVHLAGLSGRVDLEVPQGSTAADVRAAGAIDDGLGLRSGGEQVPNDFPVYDDQVIVTTAPEPKHGFVA